MKATSPDALLNEIPLPPREVMPITFSRIGASIYRLGFTIGRLAIFKIKLLIPNSTVN